MFFECDGDDTHASHRIEMTAGCNAWQWLKNNGKLWPRMAVAGNMLAEMLLCVVAENWHRLHRPTTKSELRKLFPGLSGDILNESLTVLLERKVLAQGSCGCCYALVDGAEFESRGPIKV